MKQLVIVSLCIGLLSACSSPDYLAEQEFAGGCWASVDTLGFSHEFTEEDGLTKKVRTHVDFDAEYPYQNIYLRVLVTAPGKEPTLLTLHENVLSPSGEWLRELQGSHIAWDFADTPTLTLPAAGSYQVQVYQYMRDEQLCGIRSVGISLE